MSMRSGFRFQLLILVILWVSCVPAQADLPQQYRFAVLDINNGLTHNQVNCFFKDSKGYIWIGTVAGLNRYNAHQLRVFRSDARDSSSINGNDVYKIFEDPEGNVWVNTSKGYSLYDPETEKFNRTWKDQLKAYSLPGATIEDIVKDKSGNFWFIQDGAGLTRYNPTNKESLTLSKASSNGQGISTNHVSAIGQTSEGDFWVLHQNGILEKLDGTSLQVVERNSYLLNHFEKERLNYKLTIDSDDDLWVYLPKVGKGVFFYDSSKRAFSHFGKESPDLQLNTNLVTGVVEESENMIWVGTDLGGINIIDKKDFSVRYVLHNSEIKNSLVHNSVYSLYKDYEGIIWIGAYKNGVNYYHKNFTRFPHFKHFASIPESLPYDDVNRFVEDDKGNLWIGTNGGGLLHLNRSTGRFTQYKHDPENPNSISSDVIVSLHFDRHKVLWIGTYYGGLNSFDGEKFTHYRNDPKNPASLSDDNVWEIFEDSKGNLWIGTVNQGLDLFNPEKKTFTHLSLANDNRSIQNSYISAIAEDHEKRIWVGGTNGIDLINRETGEVTRFLNDPGRPESLASNNVYWIFKDGQNQMWIGTEEGLDLYDPVNQAFRHFTTKDGLPHNTILTIQEDDQRNLWISTPNGLSQLNIVQLAGKFTVAVKNFDERDGLQGKVFNENAALKTRSGELVFGGSNGFNIFNPEKLEKNIHIPPVIFTDFQLFNKSVGIGEKVNERAILSNSLSHTDKIVLEHNQNLFSLEFAALGFFQPEKNTYRYTLIGFDQKWHEVDNANRRVTYTNLDPGEYEFRVQAANNDGVWNEEGRSLKIAVLAPFWKTNHAYALYAGLILLALFIGRRMMLQKERVKFQFEQERREARQMHELDLMKIRFFTNVSHEFRTPLALILAPLEKLLSRTEDQESLKQYQMIHRNAKRLLNLVNQLLDFRKLEVEGMNFYPSEGNVIKFLEESVQSFSDLSEKKNIELSFWTNTPELQASFDMDKLEKILFNLLSNAFKFTPDHGKIEVEVRCHQNDSCSVGIKILEIKVRDTGIGIPKEKQDKVFERFFRNEVPSSLVNQGSGIGLSIVKEFVKIHGGTISVDSELNVGSCFTVSIPVKEVGGESLQDGFMEDKVGSVQDQQIKGPALYSKDKKPLILLIEDNEDFRFYLKDNLGFYFTIIEARNGKEGWQKALANIPDLIVSDLMMPEINGIDLCKKIKQDARTSHIPFVLLTAHSAEEQKLKGLNIGANDYITKPFNFEILLSRINNLIQQRILFQKAFEKKISVDTPEIEIVSQDDKLIQDAARIVEENLSDPGFSVEVLGRELGMSRANLYKKLLALTGQSPVEFIRKIRLQRAAQYLEKGQLSVAEVAYKVGFNNTRYFSKYFKEEFNVLPSLYGEKLRRNE